MKWLFTTDCERVDVKWHAEVQYPSDHPLLIQKKQLRDLRGTVVTDEDLGGAVIDILASADVADVEVDEEGVVHLLWKANAAEQIGRALKDYLGVR